VSSDQRVVQFDLGNSAVKWRAQSGIRTVARGRFAVAELASQQSLVELRGQLNAAVISSVAGGAAGQKIAEFCRHQLGVEPRFARVVSELNGLRCGYRDPAKLGVDRWLAMLAARARYSGALVVVDVGSAATFDVISAAGQHCGGYILPGLELMRAALAQGTDAVQVAPQPVTQITPGVDTAAAVRHGALAALVALAESLSRRHRALLVVGGGDAALLCKQLPDCQHYADMVLDGLAIAMASESADNMEKIR